MSENKTVPTDKSVEEFLKSVENDKRREDGLKILEMMKDITGEEPVMWGNSIVGFGDYHYKYASGREGDWFKVGFSPRKRNLTLYLMCDVKELGDSLEKLGKHKIGKGCLYINKLEDVDIGVLREIVEKSMETL
ncbi:DUF1801 domain-containing protein [Candidatus Thorarchaeota archaeon]|nr:MAG: DUF1801 domain-containing protein [Candidatus Thorarchaeota archaeon]